MTLLFMLLLFAAAVAIAHLTVLFIERPKASLWKAAAVVLSFTVFNNLAQRFSPELPTLVQWVVYIGFVALIVWAFVPAKADEQLHGRRVLCSGQVGLDLHRESAATGDVECLTSACSRRSETLVRYHRIERKIVLNLTNHPPAVEHVHRNL